MKISKFSTLCYVVLIIEPVVRGYTRTRNISYCCVGHIIDNCFVIAVYKGTTVKLGLGNLLVYLIATIVDGNITLLEKSGSNALTRSLYLIQNKLGYKTHHQS